jgi:hypothetical protein
MIDPILGKAIDIPSHSPEIKNHQSNAPKYGEHIIHTINPFLIIIQLNQIKDQQNHQG